MLTLGGCLACNTPQSYLGVLGLIIGLGSWLQLPASVDPKKHGNAKVTYSMINIMLIYSKEHLGVDIVVL